MRPHILWHVIVTIICVHCTSKLHGKVLISLHNILVTILSTTVVQIFMLVMTFNFIASSIEILSVNENSDIFGWPLVVLRSH